MRVKYIGQTEKYTVWKNQNSKREIELSNGMIFSTGIWSGMNCNSEAVLTKQGEWLCDVDSTGFNENFIVIE